MKPIRILLAAGLAAAVLPAHALTFLGASTQDGSTVTDYSSTGLMSFDLDLRSFAPATLNYSVSADDLSMPLALNAIVRNFAGAGVPGYSLTLSSGSFGVIGSVTRQFGGTTQVTASGGSATLAFTPLEFLDVEIGNALGTTPAALDWRLAGLTPGNLSLTVAVVPEPQTYALLLSGLLAVGWVARRRNGGKD